MSQETDETQPQASRNTTYLDTQAWGFGQSSFC